MNNTTSATDTAAVTNTTCTHKNDVPELCHASPVHARGSLVMATMKRGQIAMLKMPAPTKSHAWRVEITLLSHHKLGVLL